MVEGCVNDHRQWPRKALWVPSRVCTLCQGPYASGQGAGVAEAPQSRSMRSHSRVANREGRDAPEGVEAAHNWTAIPWNARARTRSLGLRTKAARLPMTVHSQSGFD